jgi:glycosyltransferase involved in cell wall biosynthesis
MGSGSMREQLQGDVERAGLTDRVRVLGPVAPEVLLRYTAGASVGVAPIEANHLSYYYSAPNKLYEYLAAGLPVVATRLPEMQRVIEEHDVGLLVEPGDVRGLSEAINRLLEEPDLYERFRANALEASKVFNWEAESKKLQALYDGLEPVAGKD